MGAWRVRATSLWRATVRALGESWIFVPLILFFGVLAKGPQPYGSRWIWIGVLVLVGPVLALTIRTCGRRLQGRSVPPAVDRVLRHFRGTSSST